MKKQHVILAFIAILLALVGLAAHPAVRERISIMTSEDVWLYGGADVLLSSGGLEYGNFDTDTQTIGLYGNDGHVEVAAPTAIATATPVLLIDSDGLSNLVEVRDAATPVFTINDGGGTNFAGAMDFDSTLNVDGAVTLNSTLDVDDNISSGDGPISITDNVDVTGRITVSSSARIDGATDLNSTLDIAGAVSSSDGPISLTDSIYVDGQANTNQVVIQGHSTQGGNLLELQQSSAARVFAIDGSGNTTITGTLTANSTTDLQDAVANSTGDLSLNDAITLTGHLSVTGNSNLRGNVFNNVGDVTLADNLDVTGALDVQGGDIILENDEVIGNPNGMVMITTTDFVVGDNHAFTGSPSVIGGGDSNTIWSKWSVIAGGYSNEITGTVLNDDARYSFLGGGNDNTINATGDDLVLVGGVTNSITGATDYAVVVGGYHNTIISATSSFIGGGAENEIVSGAHSVAGGGYDNDISGSYATVPGGRENGATGDYGFAAGRRAQATAEGSFVWGDATDADVTSPHENTAYLRATNGVTVSNDFEAGDDVIVGNWGLFTPQSAIAVTQDSTIEPTGTYQRLSAVGACQTSDITAGTAGQVLILVNTSAAAITISDTGTIMLGDDRAIDQYDTLTLISDGTNWLELSYTDN